MESEVVASDIDIGAFDDDPSAFLDIWKTINGSEFTSEFQKFLSESERDDGNLHLSAGELACLSASDVTDAVTVHSNSGENVPSSHTAALLPFQPLHSETKCVDVSTSAPILPADNYAMPIWHQNVQIRDPVMNNLQLLPTPLSTYWPDSSPELIKRRQVKQHAGLRMMLHDAHGLSGTQHVQCQSQRHMVQGWHLMPQSMQHLQQYEVMLSDQHTWTQQQPQYHVQAHCTQQTQLQPFHCQTVHTCRRAVKKKEIPVSVIGSSSVDAVTGPLQQMLPSGHGLLPHACAAAYTNVQVPTPFVQSMYAGEPSNQSQHPPSGFPVNQKGMCVNFSQVVIPEFCSPVNFIPHVATGQLFGPAGEINQTRIVAHSLDNSCPVVSDDIFVSASNHFISD